MHNLKAATSALIFGMGMGIFCYLGPWENAHGKGAFIVDLLVNPVVGWLGAIGGAVLYATFGVLVAALVLSGQIEAHK